MSSALNPSKYSTNAPLKSSTNSVQLLKNMTINKSQSSMVLAPRNQVDSIKSLLYHVNKKQGSMNSITNAEESSQNSHTIQPNQTLKQLKMFTQETQPKMTVSKQTSSQSTSTLMFPKKNASHNDKFLSYSSVENINHQKPPTSATYALPLSKAGKGATSYMTLPRESFEKLQNQNINLGTNLKPKSSRNLLHGGS